MPCRWLGVKTGIQSKRSEPPHPITRVRQRNVAATHQQHHVVARGESSSPCRRQAARRGGLREDLGALEQEHQRLDALAIRHHHDLARQSPRVFQRERRHGGRAERPCDRRDRRQLHRLPGGQRLGHGVGPLGLDAGDLDAGPPRVQGGGDAGEQAAAADAHEHVRQVRGVLGDLQADGALARGHEGIVEGVDEGQALLAQVLGFGEGFANVLAQDDVSPVAARRVEVVGRRRGRHADGGTDAELLRCVGDALGVIAAADGDDATGLLVAGEGEEFVERAARLERAGLLQALQLEGDARAEFAAEGGGGDQWSAVDPAVDAGASFVDLCEREHGVTFREGATLVESWGWRNQLSIAGGTNVSYVVCHRGEVKDSEFWNYHRVFRQHKGDLARTLRVPDPETRRRWLPVWKSKAEASAFAKDLAERTAVGNWEVQKVSDGEASEGALGPIVLQMKRSPIDILFAVDHLSQLLIQSAYPNAVPRLTYAAISFPDWEAYQRKKGGITSLVREVMPLLTGMTLDELDEVGYLVIDTKDEDTYVRNTPLLLRSKSAQTSRDTAAVG